MLHYKSLHTSKRKSVLNREYFLSNTVYFPTYFAVNSNASYDILKLELSIKEYYSNGDYHLMYTNSFMLPLDNNIYKNTVSLITPCNTSKYKLGRKIFGETINPVLECKITDMGGNEFEEDFSLILDFLIKHKGG